jgi:uncharacterized protein (TIGR02611 family)
MESLRKSWKRLPAKVRQTIVLIIGMSLVILAPFTGVLPGPGGIPIFLLGVAILATEFHWAARLRDYFLLQIERLSAHYRKHRTLGNVLIALIIAGCGTMMFVLYTRVL